MDPVIYYVAALFLLASFIYGMVGQGGGSGYLAIMALLGIPYAVMPSTALACNIVATVGIAYHFCKAGYFKFRLLLPFIITSIPAAFIGGRLSLPEAEFKIVLIIILVIAAVRLLFWKAHKHKIKVPSVGLAFTVGPIIGIFLGLIAGLIGIGGGIFLLPTILFLRWGSAKEGALAGCLFTLVNSVSGLIAHGTKGNIDFHIILPLVIAVVIGSQLGAYLGAKKISSAVVQKVFAGILFVVAIRLVATLM